MAHNVWILSSGAILNTLRMLPPAQPILHLLAHLIPSFAKTEHFGTTLVVMFMKMADWHILVKDVKQDTNTDIIMVKSVQIILIKL